MRRMSRLLASHFRCFSVCRNTLATVLHVRRLDLVEGHHRVPHLLLDLDILDIVQRLGEAAPPEAFGLEGEEFHGSVSEGKRGKV